MKLQIKIKDKSFINETRYVEVQKEYYPRRAYRIVNKQHTNRYFLEDFATFDSETSWNHDLENPKSWVYQWGFYFREQFIGGRKISDFLEMLVEISEYYALNEEKQIVVYVHNLSYDATFLMDWMNEIDKVELFCLSPHKILTMRWLGFEFRDSYRLSNMSLDNFCKQMNTDVGKAVGAIDYNVIRYQDTGLTENDWMYQIQDCISLHNAITKKMKMEHDNVATIPLTSTGYVRRDCRKATKNKKDRDVFIENALNSEQYLMCQQAFAGGYTHGNRWLAGKIIEK